MTISYRRAFLFFIAAGAMALVVPGCTPDASDDAGKGDSTATSGGDAASANEETARRFYDEVLNKGNVDLIDSLVAADFIDHTPSPGQDSTVAGLKKWVSEMRTGFPDSKIEVLHIFTKGDQVMTHIRQTGTNSGPMMGRPATNKAIDMRGVDIIGFRDGKAYEHWGYFEEMKMMTQLGMMPAMPGMPPADSAGASAAPADTATAAPSPDTTK